MKKRQFVATIAIVSLMIAPFMSSSVDAANFFAKIIFTAPTDVVKTQLPDNPGEENTKAGNQCTLTNEAGPFSLDFVSNY